MKNYNKISNDIKQQDFILENLEAYSKKEKIPIIDREVGFLLRSLVFSRKPSSILELGCGIGYSTFFLLQDSGDASYLGIDMNKARVNKAQRFIKDMFNNEKIGFIAGNALDILKGLNRSFDFVFIDGAKYEYPMYLEALKGLLSKGSIIVADDIFYKKKVFSKILNKHDKNSVEGLRKYIRLLQENKDFQNIFIDISDGISLSIYS